MIIEKDEYEEKGKEIQKRIEERAIEISALQKKLKNTKTVEELETLTQRLDILLKEVKMDQELNEDILNMLEVEHFLTYGNGQNFDPEY
jgi:hypothetical protein